MNKSLKKLLLINSVFVFGASLLGPLYAVFVKEIGGDILTIGWTFAAYMFAGGIMSYFAGRLGDKLKETEYLIAAGYIIRAVGFFLYTLIGSPLQLLLLQFFLGAGEAVANPAFKSIFSRHLDSKKSTTQWGTWDLLYSIITALGVGIGAFIVEFLGFNILFYIMSISSLLAFILLIIQPRKLL